MNPIQKESKIYETLLNSWKLTSWKGHDHVTLELFGTLEQVTQATLRDIKGKRIETIESGSIIGGINGTIKQAALVDLVLQCKKTAKLFPVLRLQGQEVQVWLIPPLNAAADADSASGSSSGTTSSSKDLENQGRALYAEALEAHKDANYEKAIRLFEEAKRLFVDCNNSRFASNTQKALDKCKEKKAKQKAEDEPNLANSQNRQLYFLGATLLENADKATENSLYPEAIKLIEDALNIFEKIDNKEAIEICYISLGNIYNSLANHSKAIENFENSLRSAKKAGRKEHVCSASSGLGKAYFLLSNYPKAIEYHNTQLRIAKEINNKESEAAAHGNLGNVYRLLSDYPKAISHYEESLIIAKQIEHKQGESAAYGNLGIIYRSLGDFRKAIEYQEKTLKIAKEIKNKQGEGAAYANLGNIYQALGNYPQAVDYHEMHLHIAKQTENKQGEGAAYGNLGIAYQLLGNFRKAIEHQKNALQLFKQIEHKQDEGNAYGNLGNTYQALGNYLKAIECYEKHLSIAKKINDKKGEGNAYANLGNAYRALDNFPKAIECYEKNISIAKQIENKLGEGNTYGNLGAVYLLLRELPKAIGHLEQSLSIAKEIEDKQGENTVYLNLGSAYFEQKNYEKSEENLLKAVEGFAQIQQALPQDAWKITIFEEQSKAYRALERTYLASGQPNKALEICERSRARALCDLLCQRIRATDSLRNELESFSVNQMQTLGSELKTTFVVYSRMSIEKVHIWVISENELTTVEINTEEIFNNKDELTLPDWVVDNSLIGGAPVGRSSDKTLKGADFDILRKLYTTLISPIEDQLSKDPGKTITFVTNDVLNDVPFGVLLSPKDEFFIENHPYVIAPSIRLLKLLQEHKDTLPFQENPIILTGPDTRKATEAVDLITPLFPDSKTALTKATPSQVKTELKERSGIHIYSHGTQVQEENIGGETYQIRAKKNRQDSVFEGALCLHPSGKEGYLYGEDVLEFPCRADLVF